MITNTITIYLAHSVNCSYNQSHNNEIYKHIIDCTHVREYDIHIISYIDTLKIFKFCEEQHVFVKHDCPHSNTFQMFYFQYKGHSQGHKGIDPGFIWKSFTEYAYKIWSLFLLRFKSYGQGFSFLSQADTHTHRQTGQNLDAPRMEHKNKRELY